VLSCESHALLTIQEEIMETEVLDLKSLSSRIARLETQNRRLKCGAAVLGLFVAALVSPSSKAFLR